ncbi:MAG TPA: class I SAM-dependent methyltransferase [Oligoflexia bacterium]|nr:class I SAM-dependent methyltransferase [Oligoflexia bacterium]
MSELVILEGAGPSLDECKQALAYASVPPVDKLAKYMQLVLAINETNNLTGAKTPKEFAVKHIADTWLAIQALGRPSREVVDVGSGGGLPGIPIAVIVPEVKVLLVERRQKKYRALEHMISKLGLESRVRAKCETLEAMTKLPEDAEFWFRGVLPGPKLALLLTSAFPRADIKTIVLMKGPGWGDEKLGIMNEKGVKQIWKERFSDAQEVEYELPHGAGSRTLVIV